MGIEDLREEAKKLCDIKIKYVNDEEAAAYHLSTCNPANTMEDNEIYVLQSMPTEEKIQAEAHELGHIYVREKGIVCVGSAIYAPEEYDFFTVELNNALSHKIIIKMLQEKFNISSTTHIRLRAEGIKSMKRDIKECQNETILLRGLGLRLYDILMTIPGVEEEVEQLAKTNTYVYETYTLAYKYLSQVSIDMSEEEQKRLITGFLEQFNYIRYTDFAI